MNQVQRVPHGAAQAVQGVHHDHITVAGVHRPAAVQRHGLVPGRIPGPWRHPRPHSPRARFEHKAAVPTGCRVVTIEKLASLRFALERFATSLADTDAFRDPARIGSLLESHGLTAAALVRHHTVAARPAT